MDIKDLRCFLAVAEHLNFSRAAESLYISQPALSQRINSLEKSLGTSLFLRTHQQVYLTSAGQHLLPEIRKILEAADDLPRLARKSQQEEAKDGKVSVRLDASLPETMTSVLTDAFSILFQKYPQVDVAIDSVEIGKYENLLLTRMADVCLVGLKGSEAVNTSFSSLLIKKEPMILAFSGGEYRSNEQLLSEREVLLLESEDRWNSVLLGYLNSVHIFPKIRMIKGGPALCVSLLKETTITFMPKSFFESIHIQNLHYRDAKIPDSYVYTTLLWDKSNLNPALQLLINCLQDDGIEKELYSG